MVHENIRSIFIPQGKIGGYPYQMLNMKILGKGRFFLPAQNF